VQLKGIKSQMIELKFDQIPILEPQSQKRHRFENDTKKGTNQTTHHVVIVHHLLLFT
jgi:hypothetical protein